MSTTATWRRRLPAVLAPCLTAAATVSLLAAAGTRVGFGPLAAAAGVGGGIALVTGVAVAGGVALSARGRPGDGGDGGDGDSDGAPADRRVRESVRETSRRLAREAGVPAPDVDLTEKGAVAVTFDGPTPGAVRISLPAPTRGAAAAGETDDTTVKLAYALGRAETWAAAEGAVWTVATLGTLCALGLLAPATAPWWGVETGPAVVAGTVCLLTGRAASRRATHAADRAAAELVDDPGAVADLVRRRAAHRPLAPRRPHPLHPDDAGVGSVVPDEGRTGDSGTSTGTSTSTGTGAGGGAGTATAADDAPPTGDAAAGGGGRSTRDAVDTALYGLVVLLRLASRVGSERPRARDRVRRLRALDADADADADGGGD